MNQANNVKLLYTKQGSGNHPVMFLNLAKRVCDDF